MRVGTFLSTCIRWQGGIGGTSCRLQSPVCAHGTVVLTTSFRHASTTTAAMSSPSQAVPDAPNHSPVFGRTDVSAPVNHAQALHSTTGPTLSPSSESAVAVAYTPGSGVGEEALAVPTTALTSHCDVLSETLSKTQELEQQRLAQEALGGAAVILTADSLQEMLEELQELTRTEVLNLVESARETRLMQSAGMHELRRTLFYAVNLHERGWIESSAYTTVMRSLTVELLRRDSEGVLGPDDVLYVSTYMIAANFYNRHLWNRLEHGMLRTSIFESIDLQTVKALTTKLFKTRRGCPSETLDIRRKILNAMARRVGLFANEFDLPSLLGILQCYSVHDMTPHALEPLAVRATNHIHELTPHECATLAHVLRKFRLLRLEVCERLIERICASNELNQHMASAALTSIRVCYNRVSDGGRGALHAEPTRQKLRAIGEQVGARLDEVEFTNIRAILNTLDVIVNVKMYVPKRCLTALFGQAHEMLVLALGQKEPLTDPVTGRQAPPMTAEQGRHLQALLLHYGPALCPELQEELKKALRESALPDEASLA